MGAVNAQNIQSQPALLYVSALPANLLALAADGSNAAAVRADIASKCVFSRLASVVGLKVDTDMAADLKEIIADDTGTIYKASRPSSVATATWYESGNEDARALVVGRAKVAVAGASTPVVGEAYGTAPASWVLGQPIAVTNKNGDNTSVTAITVKIAAASKVLNTDYRVYVGNGTNGTLGVTYIVPLTVGAGAITFDYTYVPYASAYSSIPSTVSSLARLVVKIVTVADTLGKVQEEYLVDASLSGAITDSFLDPANNDIEGSQVELTTNKGGYVLRYNERI